jgi:hypothetical protein
MTPEPADQWRDRLVVDTVSDSHADCFLKNQLALVVRVPKDAFTDDGLPIDEGALLDRLGDVVTTAVREAVRR